MCIAGEGYGSVHALYLNVLLHVHWLSLIGGILALECANACALYLELKNAYTSPLASEMSVCYPTHCVFMFYFRNCV